MSDSRPAARLEELWAGEFGDQYVERNKDAEVGRGQFWREQIERLRPSSVLEVGCNIGGNLRWIADQLGPANVAGVDVNERALQLLRERVPGVDARLTAGGELPFGDGTFDLVFTMGVLIHQDPKTQLEPMMREIVRCSRRHVLAGEYAADTLTEVPYRGQEGALFKQDFGALYERLFPQLRLVGKGFLSARDGSWDDITYWIFEKTQP
jgi:pseudaminic acid biosynthesis-associated methylase